MKKFFIAIAALALVASAACTKVEKPATEKAITFSVANYVPATKAGEVSFLKEFADPANAHFQSVAFMKGVGVNGYQDFFGAGETITWNATAKEWAPSHTYYWPKYKESYINFFSWYDTGAGPTTKENGKLEWKDRTIATGDNIMYADPAWRFQMNLKEYPKLDDETIINEGVPTLFRHALAQVEIRAYAEKLEVANLLTWTVKLTDLELKVNNVGTLSLSATEPTSGYNIKGEWNGTPAWVASGEKNSIVPASFNVTATDATATDAKLLANQSVLPQDLTGVSIKFNLDITTTYNAGEHNQEIIPVEIPLAAAVADGGFNTPAWALNTKYIYTIKVVPSENKVLFDPAVEAAWETVDAGEKAL